MNNPASNLFFLLSVFAAQLTACSQPNQTDYVASGRHFLATGDYPAASIQLKNAVLSNPNEAEPHFLLGQVLARIGDHESALIELRKAASLAYDPDQIFLEVSRSLLSRGEFNSVLDEATSTQGKTPVARAEILSIIAEAKLGLRDITGAKRASEEAAKLAPDIEPTALVKAKVLIAEGNLKEGEALVDAALAKHPESLGAMLMKGDLSWQSNPKDALAFYQKAIAAHPRSVRGYLGAIPLLLESGQSAAAHKLLNDLSQFIPNNTAKPFLEALVAHGDRNFIGAKDAIQAALKSPGASGSILLLASSIEIELGHYILAEEYANRLLSIEPDLPTGLELLIRARLGTGQIGKAAESFEKLRLLAPKSLRTIQLGGELAAARGITGDAIKYFQQALALEPNSATSLYRLGMVQLSAGQADQAIENLESAVRRPEAPLAAARQLVDLYLARKQIDRALVVAERILENSPRAPDGLVLLGKIQFARGDIRSARESFSKAAQQFPSFVLAARALADLDMADGKPVEARKRYETVLQSDSKSVEAALLLARLLGIQGAASDEIEALLTKSLQANPEDPRLHLAVIDQLAKAGKRKAALAAAVQAQSALPDNGNIIQAAGNMQVLAGEYGPAVTTFGKLAHQYPRAAHPLLSQAEAYAADFDWTHAADSQRQAIEREPQVLTHRTRLIEFLINSKKFGEALSEARLMQNQFAPSPAGHLAEAMIFSTQGKNATAEEILRKSLAQFDIAPLANQLISFLANNSREHEIASIVSDWAAKHPKDPSVASFAAEREISKKQYSKAVHWYDVALHASPANPLLMNNAAWTMLQANDPRAKETAERAVALAPNHPAILETLGRIYIAKGMIALGLDTLSKAVDASNGDTTMRIELAKALISAGRKDAAKALLQKAIIAPGSHIAREKILGILSAL